MSTIPSEFDAPWGAWVKLVSIGTSALLVGLGLFEAIVLPRELGGGWPWLLATALPAV